jgi:hypothetical protein
MNATPLANNSMPLEGEEMTRHNPFSEVLDDKSAFRDDSSWDFFRNHFSLS